jgi:hypothetical protein
MRPAAVLGAAMIGALWLAAACSPAEPPPRAERRTAAVPGPVVEDTLPLLQDLMEWVVEPAADVVFAAGGREAPPDRRPAGVTAWQAVADAADRLVQQAAVLAQPALVADRADWLGLAHAMRRSAAQVQEAALAQDAPAVAQASDALRASCQGCHLRYAAALAQRVGGAAGTPP